VLNDLLSKTFPRESTDQKLSREDSLVQCRDCTFHWGNFFLYVMGPRKFRLGVGSFRMMNALISL